MNHDSWEAPALSSVSFTVPNDWEGGRIWVLLPPWFSIIMGRFLTVEYLKGRRDCDFSNNPGPNSCIDGGCNGGLECDKLTGTVSNLRLCLLSVANSHSSLVGCPSNHPC
jgi:hypothetical protein